MIGPTPLVKQSLESNVRSAPSFRQYLGADGQCLVSTTTLHRRGHLLDGQNR